MISEILSDRVRRLISKGKCTGREWLEIMRVAHKLNITTSGIHNENGFVIVHFINFLLFILGGKCRKTIHDELLQSKIYLCGSLHVICSIPDVGTPIAPLTFIPST